MAVARAFFAVDFRDPLTKTVEKVVADKDVAAAAYKATTDTDTAASAAGTAAAAAAAAEASACG